MSCTATTLTRSQTREGKRGAPCRFTPSTAGPSFNPWARRHAGTRPGPTELVGLREHVALVHDVHRGHALGDDLLVLVLVLVVLVLHLPLELLQQPEAAHHDVRP